MGVGLVEECFDDLGRIEVLACLWRNLSEHFCELSCESFFLSLLLLSDMALEGRRSLLKDFRFQPPRLGMADV